MAVLFIRGGTRLLMWDNVSLIFYLHRADLTIKVDGAEPGRKKVRAFFSVFFFSPPSSP